ncbi:MAG: hypothetical protein OXC28_19595 [Defluviicoccus sp.]|nr:hypothetical protein [Defluviicoccus sp.]
MDPVQITMLGVGVALAALIVTLNGSLRRDMDKRFEGVDKRLDGIDARLRLVEQGLAEVKDRLAFVESFILGRTETAAGEAPAE